MRLDDLEIYNLAREISREAWKFYSSFSWDIKKIIGDQFIRAIDSVGANIAEGRGRFHFLDRNKFNYNARASLVESGHWLELLIERDLIPSEQGAKLKSKIEILHFKLNNYIRATKETKKQLE